MKFMSVDEIKYPKDWPPEDYYVPPTALADAVKKAFGDLLDHGASETDADNFLQENSALLAQCLNFTNFGHHGIWVVPQKTIDPGAIPDRKGLKPDYLLGGKNSDGFHWCVAELKGPQDKLFKRVKDKRRTISLSSIANEGLCQLLQYMDYCNSAQAYFRDHFKLNDFKEPRGFLIIGREAEFENDKQLMDQKAMLNRVFGGRIIIRTYDALLRSTTSSWLEHNE